MPKAGSTRSRAFPTTPAHPKRARVATQTPHLFEPTEARPVRAKERWLVAETFVTPHRHPWPQLTTSGNGVIRLSTEAGTTVIPPSRAVWVPAGMEHSITVVEDAHLRTVYLWQPLPQTWAPCWRESLVLEMTPLLQALVFALDTTANADGTDPPAPDQQRDRLIWPLLCDELGRAPQIRMGVALPDASRGDKRLRAICEAVLQDPARRATLAEWAQQAGASERTAARLFREGLGMSWQQWRQQALLAHALPLLARGMPVAHVAAASGYASDSAFTAMFRQAMGRSPRHFHKR